MLEFSEFIVSIFNPITEFIDLIAILFILWGLVKALFDYFALRIKSKTLNHNDIKVIEVLYRDIPIAWFRNNDSCRCNKNCSKSNKR